MGYSKEIICLANSRKISGRCIAGKEIVGGKIQGWIRPISERDNHEISEVDRRYSDGSTAQVLDKIVIHFKSAEAHLFQSENHLIDDEVYWEKTGEFTKGDVIKNLDTPRTLWVNGNSSGKGTNDCLPIASIAHMHDPSLYLIKPEGLIIMVRDESWNGNSKKKVRARFSYGGQEYQFSISDPDIERDYFAKGVGEYAINTDHTCMTISISEPLPNGNCYKLVASILGI